MIYLAFGKSKVPRWWNIFLKKDFQHCFYFVQHGETWLRVDACKDSITVCIDSPADYIESHKLVKVSPKQANRSIITLSTCVSLCKKAIGIKKPFLWTPYQLYREVKSWDC